MFLFDSLIKDFKTPVSLLFKMLSECRVTYIPVTCLPFAIVPGCFSFLVTTLPALVSTSKACLYYFFTVNANDKLTVTVVFRFNTETCEGRILHTSTFLYLCICFTDGSHRVLRVHLATQLRLVFNFVSG